MGSATGVVDLTGASAPVVIACASDAAYVMPLAAMLRSVVDNLSARRTAAIHILYSRIPPARQEEVERSLPAGRCVVHWIPADDSMFSGLPLWGRMPVSTYFKLSIADLLPADADRVVWLDCDLLVLDDIGALWEQELDGRHLGAVQDAIVPRVSSRFGVANYARLGMNADAMYFNAGVMLVDLAQWRRDRVSAHALDYLRSNSSSVVFWDQEGLNVALYSKWKALEPRWNLNASIPGARSNNAAASVVHFAGNLKPWRYRTRHKLRSLYYEYLDRTVYSGWRPAPSAAAAMISLYENSGLRSLVYPAEKAGMRLVRRVTATH
jgi:lipopolysaccharide biosynthesis glycosyltransferase